ncbi:hypothetical protein JRO89_XS02G0146000 [Xanthoceras sorbifolium]|uniref:PAR1 protein n=1 Tax=Xanthoceras sorbifolium TaxID=99658 RepID=A0ABQ8IGC7_9ROSI|nr:hypothetical protein JRO89_XS02G0146000 [Xanthoceras sorbifolium]
MALVLFLAFSFFLQGALRGIICEQLPTELCSFSVSSSGKRCLLENFAASDGTTAYQCKTSEVAVNIMQDWIETDECISACGVDRKSVGISSDSLLQPQLAAKLCSNACYQSCPNIVDLYFNLALGEGVYLPTLCQEQRTNPRRVMADIRSSGVAKSPVSSPGPASSESYLFSAVSPMSSEDQYMAPAMPTVGV